MPRIARCCKWAEEHITYTVHADSEEMGPVICIGEAEIGMADLGMDDYSCRVYRKAINFCPICGARLRQKGFEVKE